MFFGLVNLNLVRLHFLDKNYNFSFFDRLKLFKPIVLGLSFGFAWTPCIGPILASILSYSAAGKNYTSSLIMLGFYSIGLGIPFLLAGLLCILILLSGLSKKRLRVQHSVDRLVFESTFLGRVNYSKERPLSEAAYLEYKVTVHHGHDADGNSTESTRRTYIVHGHSSEEGEWEISIEDLILQSERHGRKAREIAEAIGIEVMGNP